MSKTEEISLSRLGTASTDLPSLLQEALRRREEDRVLRAIVADNRNPVHPSDPGGKVGVAGAGEVVTGNDGAAHTPTRGWAEARSIAEWRAPGLEIMDRLVDLQDAIDRAEREAQLRKLKGGG
jgi:hypothetical protein